MEKLGGGGKKYIYLKNEKIKFIGGGPFGRGEGDIGNITLIQFGLSILDDMLAKCQQRKKFGSRNE